MKIALLNDVHFGARNDHEGIAAAQKKFYSETFFPYLQNNEIDTIFLLGDVFDRRKYINFKSLQAAKDMFFDPAAARKTHILLGNHDVFWKNSNSINSPELLLSGYPKISFYQSHPTIETFDGRDIGIIPWICMENAEECLDFIKTARVEVIFGHFDIVGFEMMPGIECHEGLDPKLFDRFEMVLTGHYHLKSKKHNITYLGSQYQMDWGDYGTKKGFHVLDTRTLQLDFIQNPDTMFEKVFYKNDMEAPEGLNGKFVKLIVKEKADLHHFEKFVAGITAQGLEDLQILEQDISILEESVEAEDGAAVKSTPQIIQDYIKSSDLEERVKVPLADLMMELYTEAVSE